MASLALVDLESQSSLLVAICQLVPYSFVLDLVLWQKTEAAAIVRRFSSQEREKNWCTVLFRSQLLSKQVRGDIIAIAAVVAVAVCIVVAVLVAVAVAESSIACKCA